MPLEPGNVALQEAERHLQALFHVLSASSETPRPGPYIQVTPSVLQGVEHQKQALPAEPVFCNTQQANELHNADPGRCSYPAPAGTVQRSPVGIAGEAPVSWPQDKGNDPEVSETGSTQTPEGEQDQVWLPLLNVITNATEMSKVSELSTSRVLNLLNQSQECYLELLEIMDKVKRLAMMLSRLDSGQSIQGLVRNTSQGSAKDSLLTQQEERVQKLQSEIRLRDDLLQKRAAELMDCREKLKDAEELSQQADSDRGAPIVWQLRAQNDELTSRVATLQEQLDACMAREIQTTHSSDISAQLAHSRGMLQRCEEELAAQRSENLAKTHELKQLDLKMDNELDDYGSFLKHLAYSSASPALSYQVDLNTTDVIGMGNYGFIFTCEDLTTRRRVVVKAHSQRWADVVVKEWAHGLEMGKHSNVVVYSSAIMHFDQNHEIQKYLVAGFEDGTLTGRRPKRFPECYFCLLLEYMDRGSVQHLMDKHFLTVSSVAAVTRQVASALGYMHKKHRTHNDVKPDNILLQQSPTGQHLIVKLADFGLASHSTDRTRDHDLFAYTIWCMALGRKFHRCPGQLDRPSAIGELERQEPSSNQLWQGFSNAVKGLWGGMLDTSAVEEMQVFAGHEVQVPIDLSHDLEEDAKHSIVACGEVVARRWHRTKSALRSLVALSRLNLAIKADEDECVESVGNDEF